jgi:SAM-dependent methyltransferase
VDSSDGVGAGPGSAAPPAARRPSDAAESARASRRWWDEDAERYLDEHGAFLGEARFVWGPEGLSESEAGLLGDVSGRRVLEVGCGAAQCSRWLAARGAEPVGLDLSWEMLDRGRVAGRAARLEVPLVQGDAQRLPFGSGTFDLACSAYGALPFVADSAGVMREVARVLRPGGRWVFSVTHPVRWVFADDGGEEGLVARDSYFDRTPYVEQEPDGTATYVEHHRTLGDRVRELVSAGFRLVDLVEPEWPADHTRAWGQWSPLRGRVIPGTAIFVCRLDESQ